MIGYPLLIFFLLGELVALITLSLFIVLHRFFRFFSNKRKDKKKEIVANYYHSLFESKKTFSLQDHPEFKGWVKSILEVVENFNETLSGDQWLALRNSVVETILLPTARKWCKSILWTRRNYASRTFRLYAKPEDENSILDLMNDKKFLVRNPAAIAAICIESQKGVLKLFQELIKDKQYAQFIYRDALLFGSGKVFQYILEIAKDNTYHLPALSILSGKSWGKEIPFLQNDLSSQDPNTRLLALKVLIRNPLIDSHQYFEKEAQDSDPSIRAVAMEGIGFFSSNQSYEILKKGLCDSVWEVRLSAARACRKLGEPGIKILNELNETISSDAAKYVLTFG